MRVALILCLLGATLNATESVRIGVNLSLAPGGVASAIELRDAMLIAQEELNARPETLYKYELLFEDNSANSRGSALASQKLIHIDKVDALITVFDYAIAPSVPLAKQANIASVGIGWGASLIDGKHSFLFGWSELSQANRLADYLESKQNKKITIIAARQAGVPGIVKRIQERLAGMQKPTVIWYNREDWDLRPMLLRVKESNPDCLVLLSWDSDFKKIMYQLKQMPEFKPELIGLGFSFRFAEDRTQTIGAVFVASKEYPTVLCQKYEIRYHRKITHDYAPYAYDGVKFLANILEKSPNDRTPIRQRFLNVLRSTQRFDGATGNYTQDGGVFDTTSSLYRITPKGEVQVP